MRTRRFGRNISGVVFPAICIAVGTYFASSAVLGDRGIMELRQAREALATEARGLAQVQTRREGLARRIAGLAGGSAGIDTDLLDEMTHTVLLASRPGEVAVPREKR